MQAPAAHPVRFVHFEPVPHDASLVHWHSPATHVDPLPQPPPKQSWPKRYPQLNESARNPPHELSLPHCVELLQTHEDPLQLPVEHEYAAGVHEVGRAVGTWQSAESEEPLPLQVLSPQLALRTHFLIAPVHWLSAAQGPHWWDALHERAVLGQT